VMFKLGHGSRDALVSFSTLLCLSSLAASHFQRLQGSFHHKLATSLS
jgi:hypothetical protein